MKLVAENFVPVALNADRLPDNAEGKFFRTLLKQWPQGLWVVAPEGKVLGFHYHKPKPGESYSEGQVRWVRETTAMLADAVKDAGPLPMRDAKAKPDPFANRGKGTNPNGGVRLAVSVIQLRNGKQEGPPVVDSIFLTGEQWGEFRPKGTTKVDQEWALSEDAASRFAPAFSPMTDSIFSPKSEDVTKAKIIAKVERLADGIAAIRFSGNWETAHDRDKDPKFPIHTSATGEGIGVFDVRTGKLKSLVWLLSGEFQNGAKGKSQRTAAIVEWKE